MDYQLNNHAIYAQQRSRCRSKLKQQSGSTIVIVPAKIDLSAGFKAAFTF